MKCIRCGAETKGYKYCIECREKKKYRPIMFKEGDENGTN